MLIERKAVGKRKEFDSRTQKVQAYFRKDLHGNILLPDKVNGT